MPAHTRYNDIFRVERSTRARARILEGERLTLRTVEPEDREFIHHHWNDASIRRWTNRQRPQTKDEIGELLEGEDIYLLPCLDSEAIGLVWLFRIDQLSKRGELGYWIIPERRGHGYATEAADLGVTYAFDELGLTKVLARVFAGNEGSKRVLDKLGFKQEGLLRDHYWIDVEYVDTHLYGRSAPGR